MSKQVYISAVSHSSVTISGPPSTLEQFFKGANAFGTTPYSAPIGGPYHAPHLYLRTDPQHFMPCADAHVSSVLDSHHLSLPLVSSSAGCLVNSSLTTREIFCIIIDDVLSHPLHLDKILDRCVDAARTQLAQRCTIHSLGPSLAGNSLSATLMKQTGIEVTLDQSSVQPPLINGISGSTRGSSKSKIAIVGMAGRFPDAADHDKLWELLEAGLDVHRKVSHLTLNSAEHLASKGDPCHDVRLFCRAF